jgi:hypothetical protein
MYELRDRIGRHLVGLNVMDIELSGLGVSMSHQRVCPTSSTSLEPA